jgi:perosamine synthetase
LQCRTLSLPGCEISWFVFVVRLADSASGQRDRILQAMWKRGIQVNNYFSPVHLQPFMVERFGSKLSI